MKSATSSSAWTTTGSRIYCKSANANAAEASGTPEGPSRPQKTAAQRKHIIAQRRLAQRRQGPPVAEADRAAVADGPEADPNQTRTQIRPEGGTLS